MPQLDPRLLLPEPALPDWPRGTQHLPTTRPIVFDGVLEESLDFLDLGPEPNLGQPKVSPPTTGAADAEPLPASRMRPTIALSVLYFAGTFALVAGICLAFAPDATAGAASGIPSAIGWAGDVLGSLARTLP